MNYKFLTVIILVLILSTAIFAFQGMPGASSQHEQNIFQKIWNWFVSLQKDLNRKLSDLMVTLQNDLTTKQILFLSGISFLYGMIHAAGPGHGKMLVGSYFLNTKAKISTAAKIGLTVALTHNGIALLLGILFGVILKVSGLEERESFRDDIQMVSGIIILLIGVVYVLSNFKFFKRKLKQFAENRHDFLIGVLSGIVPCPVAMTVILFSIYLKALKFGILSVIMLSLGMAITVTFIGIIAIKFKSFIIKLPKWSTKTQDKIHLVLSIVGAVGITLAGLFLIFAR